jgi:CBS domain-containing protein
MKISECMSKQVELTSPDTTVSEAARLMRDGDFGFLPVGENDRLVGMITDRDITVRAVAEGKDPRNMLVREVMSTDVFYCYEDQDTSEVAKNMGQNRVRRLPVLSRQKRMVGIISLTDIAKAPSADAKFLADAIRNISRKEGELGLRASA